MSYRNSFTAVLRHKAGKVLVISSTILVFACLGLLADNMSKRREIAGLSSEVTMAPYVHVMSVPYSLNDIALCLNNAENALTKLGYTDQRIRQHDNDEPFGWVYGDKVDGSVSATIMCNMMEKRAITSFAVGGMDSENTLDAFRTMFKAKW